MLVALADAVLRGMDDWGEELSDGGFLIHGEAMAEINKAIEDMEALPDDRPGYVMSLAARAEWSVTRLLPLPPAIDTTNGGTR